jgi:acetyl-CoA C-acetyltransferase
VDSLVPGADQGSVPKGVSSERINKVCASGLLALVLLDQAIRAGDVEVSVGMESMSKVPYLLRQGRFGHRMGAARAHQPVQRQAVVRRGDRDRRRTGDGARGTRPLGAGSHELALKAVGVGRIEGLCRSPSRRSLRPPQKFECLC